jgi:hypothetical protein
MTNQSPALVILHQAIGPVPLPSLRCWVQTPRQLPVSEGVAGGRRRGRPSWWERHAAVRVRRRVCQRRAGERPGGRGPRRVRMRLQALDMKQCEKGSSWPFAGRVSQASRTWVLASTKACPGPGTLPTRDPSRSLRDPFVPSDLGHDSESEGEVTEAPQPRTVEAMCMANWPAHERPTEARQATLHQGAIRGLEDEPPMEKAIVSSRGCGQNRGRILEGPPTVWGTSPRARWVSCRSHAWLRPCTRPTGLHRGGRPMRSRPLRRGQLPVVVRRCLLGEGIASRSRPLRRGSLPMALRGHLLGRRVSHRQGGPGPQSSAAEAPHPRTVKAM